MGDSGDIFRKCPLTFSPIAQEIKVVPTDFCIHRNGVAGTDRIAASDAGPCHTELVPRQRGQPFLPLYLFHHGNFRDARATAVRTLRVV